MEGEIILKGLIAIAIGAILLWTSWKNWKHRDSDAIPQIERQILSLTGEDPLPRTRFDRISRRVQAVLGFVLGPIFLFLGIAVFSLLGD